MEELNNSELIKHPEIAAEIISMAGVDQDMRLKAIDDEKFWDESVDPKNTARMKEIVAEIGWPTVSKVGSDASVGAWLLVQHADREVEFQEHCLNLMKQEKEGEVVLRDVAHLEDRVRLNKGLPQLYGTQFRWTKNNEPIQDIEDRENVDERRKAMGLNTLAERIEEMYVKYKMERPKN